MTPKVSICIPAYNRPAEIVLLLGSIALQPIGNWDVVICEDRSPRGREIEKAVREFSGQHSELKIHYSANDRNLGYDGNLRQLLDIATGEYCVFMGDDDVLVPGALARILAAIERPGTGFILRAWRSVDKDTGNAIEEHRYFPGDRVFPPSVESVAALFRRSVFISGLTVHRETARRFHTDRFDGLLLYQLYLVGRIVSEQNGYYISDIISVRHVGGEHFFGSSEKEKGRFTPRQLLPSQSVTFVRGLFEIAKTLDTECAPGLYSLVCRDLGRYSYPMLEIHARGLPRREFRAYAKELACLGLGDNWMFWAYYIALLSAGSRISNFMIRSLKQIWGRTPNLTGNQGIAVRQ
jgi:glycosyltransferase involved in cell wall biosynthesis